MSWEAWGDGDDGSDDLVDRLLHDGWLSDDDTKTLVNAAREWMRWRHDLPYRSHNGTEVADAANKLEAAFAEVFGRDYMLKEPA